MTELVDLAKQSCSRLLELAIEDGWEVFIEECGVIGSRKEENGKTLFRGMGLISPHPPWMVANYICAPDTPSTDENFDRYEVIDNLAENTTLEHSFYKGVFPTDPRDFVYVSRVEQHGDTCIVSWVSPSDDGVSSCKNYVRGKVGLGSGWVFQPDEQGTKATYVIDIDPCGHIPVWIANQISKSEPLQVDELRKLMKKLTPSDVPTVPCNKPL